MSPTSHPAHVSLLLAFANTIDVDAATERLDSPSGLATWLTEHALAPDGVRATSTDLEAAHELREALRARMRAHHAGGSGEPAGAHRTDESPAGGSGDASGLEAAARKYPLRMAVRGGVPVVVPAAEGVPGALGSVVAAVIAAQGDGTLSRVKICAEDTCQWAFVDASKNRSRQWCSMSVCGNRAKTRTYRARRRDTP
jgi:predicted RNA-binding Zn ribbon-like protein